MKLSTSILSSVDRVESVLKLNHTSTDYIHIDVMDGKFVKDIQFETYEKVHSIHLVSQKPMDIHLMVEKPLDYIKQYSGMNIEFITFHVEINKNIDKIIEDVHEKGYKVGLAINPGTNIKVLEKYLDDIDMILVMSVEPGKGGQSFLEGTVNRIKMIKELVGKRDILIEVDGGINDKTIDKVKDVDIVVSGSYIIHSDNYNLRINNLLNGQKNVYNSDYKDYSGNIFLIIVGIIFLIPIVYYGYNALMAFLILLILGAVTPFGIMFLILLVLAIFFLYIVIRSIIYLVKGIRK